jgi:hypothetical protein
VEIEFSMCPLLTKTKVGWPKKKVYARHGLRNVEAVIREKIDKPKREQKHMQALQGSWASSWISKMPLHS